MANAAWTASLRAADATAPCFAMHPLHDTHRARLFIVVVPAVVLIGIENTAAEGGHHAQREMQGAEGSAIDEVGTERERAERLCKQTKIDHSCELWLRQTGSEPQIDPRR